MVSTIRAFKQAATYHQSLGQASKKQKRKITKKEHVLTTQSSSKITWAKTDHDFLSEQTLTRYRRTLGDILLEEGLVTPKKLAQSLRQARQEELMLGRYLKQEGVLSDEQLARALAEVWNIPYVAITELDYYNIHQFASDFDPSALRVLSAISLFSTPDGGYVVGFSEDDSRAAVEKFSKVYRAPIHPVVVSNGFIEKALQRMSECLISSPHSNSIATKLYAEGLLSYEQLVLLRSGCAKSDKSEEKMLTYMGLCSVKKDLETISL
jgi:adsorption protein B